MRSVLITATLTQSVALGVASRADHRQDTYDHVPGSVLRGALAATWLRTPGAPGPDGPIFREVFEGDGGFGPLHSTESLPMPLSIWTHKSAPDRTCRKHWWDEVDDDVPEQCPTCAPPRARLERSKGQPVGRPQIGARTRVALDDRGVAEDGKLFRRAALAGGTVLSGWLTGPAVDALTPAGTPITRLRFGGERSVRGLAEIRTDDITPPTVELAGDGTIVLRLASPGIFVDRLGHPTDKPAKSELAEILGVKITAVTAAPGWTRWTQVGGWHMASGLPKPRDRAVVAGSTYRVECAQTPPPDRLAELTARGVGLKRREGFGALYRFTGADVADTAGQRAALLATIAPLLTWSKWPRVEPLIRANTQRPLPADHILRRVLRDDSLTADQRAALDTLVDLDDGASIGSMLDELGSR